jgi:hypothetical protein
MILALINSIIITPILSNNLIWYFCKEREHTSPEQPYQMSPENRAQITKDNPGDISCDMHLDVNHILIVITQFLILWNMITNVFFLQFLAFKVFPIGIKVRPML